MYIFKVATFYLTSTYPINSFFPVVVCTYKIHVFDEAFSLLAILAMITEKMFFLFPWQPLLGENLFIKSCNLSRKFYIRRNNNKVDSIETGPIVTAHLLPWIDLVTETDKECGHTRTTLHARGFNKSRKIIAFSHLNATNFNDNFKDNFMREKVKSALFVLILSFVSFGFFHNLYVWERSQIAL